MQKVLLVAICVASGVLFAQSVADLNKELLQKTNELRKLQRENPAVEFAEHDNPAININRKVTQKTTAKKLTYANGLTTINHKFYCPFHKGHIHDTSTGVCHPLVSGSSTVTDVGVFSHNRPLSGNQITCLQCPKGVNAWAKWKELRDKIEETKKFNEQILALNDEIVALKKEIEVRRHNELVGTPTASRRSFSESRSEEVSEPQVIRLKKSTLDKLLKDGEVGNTRIKIILVDD